MSGPLPVVIFAFNRPRKLERILNAMRNQNIDHLLIFVDGPRNDADFPQVNACRLLARAVDWVPRELFILENNHGLWGFVENISQVMEIYPWAVFVEDDCLPMPGFSKFMRQALEKYINRPEVFSICGYQPLLKRNFQDSPYALVSSTRFSCWGWASWRDRWQSLIPDVRSYSKLFDNLQQVPDIVGTTDLPLLAQAMANGKISVSWDVCVAIACLNQHRVNLLATRGLIRNIGLDCSGVHGNIRGIIRDWITHNRNVVKRMPTELIWLEDLQFDKNYMCRLQEYLIQSSGVSLRSLLMKGWYVMRNL